MPVSFNDSPVESLGLFFKRDSLYKELLKLPKPKERYSFDWKDDHGKERDTISTVVYEAVTYNVACYLVAENLPDLQAKRSAILELFSSPGGFILNIHTLGKSYHVYYMDSPSFNTLTPIWTKGKLYCEFTLNLENDFQETLNEFALADSNNLIVTELNEQIIVQAYNRNF